MPESTATHPLPALIGRESVLSLSRDLLASGADVDIVGSGGSGRTSVLDALAIAATDDQITVVRLHGIRSLRNNPLAALHAAGIGSQVAPDRRPVSPLQNAIDALAAAVSGTRSVILVDDADLLDDASLGAIEAVRRSARVPIARTRSRLDSEGAHASDYVIELAPLRYDELETVLVERLGADIDAGTMSRVYAKSGGIVGLALTMVELARREGRLALKNDVWIATRSLWSPSLRRAVETYLSGLDDHHREALEMIALIGVSDVETAVKLSGFTVLEELEDAGVLRIIPSGGRQLVTVDPPLLSEFYRHEASTVRRQRLAGHVRDVLGTREAVEAILADKPIVPHGLGDGDALFVRLVHERARTRRIVAEAEWNRSSHAGTAYTYARALLADAESGELLAKTFAEGTNCPGEPLEVAQLATLHAHWRLMTGGDLDEVLDDMRARTAGLGVYARLADAAAVLFETTLRRIPEDADERLAPIGDLPKAVRSQLLSTAITVAAMRGRFLEAHALFDELNALDPHGITPAVAAMHGFTLLGEGHYDEALAWAERGVDEAHAHLDVAGLRAHSLVAALCLTTAGQYAEAEQVISTALALGEPAITDRGDHLGLLALSSLIAVRRDNPALGDKLRSDILSSSASGTLMGRIGIGWSSAQLLAYRGQPNEAAQMLATQADDMHDTHIDAWAGIALLSSLELSPDREGLDRAIELLAGTQSEFLDVHLAFLLARHERDAEAILSLVPRLTASGRPGLAVVSFRLAAEWLRDAGDLEGARRTELERDAYIADLPVRTYDATRFFATAINLTEREREISRLVASGLSNPQIAARLVLSVRTVESHLHRIMRKTSVSNRAELASLIRSIAA